MIYNHKWYIKRLFEVHGNAIHALDTYQNSQAKLSHQHFCGYEWEGKPNNILNGAGCPKCNHGGRQILDKNMVIFRIGELFGDSITMLEPYSGVNVPTLFKHDCGWEWRARPKHVLAGHSCPSCAGKLLRTNQQYCDLVEKIHCGKIIVLDDYQGSSITIRHQHTCGHVWSNSPAKIISGQGCPSCAGVSRKTHDQYVANVFSVHGDEIKAIGTYRNAYTKIEHQHVTCGHKWDATPTMITSGGTGCPVCNLGSGYQKYAVEIGGVSFNVQGYERLAIPYLVNEIGVSPIEIIVGSGNVPRFSYIFKGKNRFYYPDIYIPQAKLIFEVKSPYTLGINNTNSDVLQMNKAKCESVERYTYAVLVFRNLKTQPVLLENDWHKLSVEKLKDMLNAIS